VKLSIIYPICAFPDAADPSGKPHPFMMESLDSILRGGHDDFEILIGIDGSRPWVMSYLAYWISSRNPSIEKIKIFEVPFSGSYGNRQRNYMMSAAKGDFLCFMDQDDSYLVGALAAIHSKVRLAPTSIHIFRVLIHMFGDHVSPRGNPLVLWNDVVGQSVRKGAVGGHMFVCPNDQSHLSEWPEGLYEADYHFMKNTCDSFLHKGVETIWHEDIIANIRPWAENFGKLKFD